MARKLKTDGWLFTATLVLLVVGIAWVYSASWFKQQEDLLFKQGMWIALGLVVLFSAMQVDYKRYTHPKVLPILMGLTLVALLGVFMFPPAGGGRRWLWFGPIGVQPSEFAKLVVILFAAAALGRKLEADEPLEPALARTAIVGGLAALLILIEPDGGGAAVLAGIVAAMAFTAGLPSRWVWIGAAAAPVLAGGVLYIQPYRLNGSRRGSTPRQTRWGADTRRCNRSWPSRAVAGGARVT